MGEMASQFTSLRIVYSTIYSGIDQRKHQSSASLTFVWGIHWWPMNSPHKGPVKQKMLPFDDVIMSEKQNITYLSATSCRGLECWRPSEPTPVSHDRNVPRPQIGTESCQQTQCTIPKTVQIYWIDLNNDNKINTEPLCSHWSSHKLTHSGVRLLRNVHVKIYVS